MTDSPKRWRTVTAVILIVLGLLLTPFAVVSNATRATLTDTDAFVGAFGPLAESPAVQDAVASAVTTAISERVDLESVADSLIQRLTGADASRIGTASLRLLTSAVIGGLRQSVSTAVDQLVGSPQFSDLWQGTLRATHPRLIATLEQDPQATISLADDTLALELGPVVQRARQRLLDEGLSFAQRIPENAQITVPLAQVDGLDGVRVAYRGVVALGVWLPIAVVVLLAAGTLLAADRLRSLVRVGLGLVLTAALTGLAVAVGRGALHDAGSTRAAALDDLYGALVSLFLPGVIVVAVIGALLAVGAWLAPRLAARRARGEAGSAAT